MEKLNRICVIGSGYVGLVTAACFAESGNTVYCIDKDKDKIEKLRAGINPIYEPGLEDLLKRNLKSNRLIFDTDLAMHINQCRVVFIAVGTPQGEDGSADLQYVLQVAEDIARSMDSYKIIVNKSTVPVGTADKVRDVIKKHTNIEFDVCSNPEFLKEGSAVKDFMSPDRIVVGADKPEIIAAMKDLYHSFTLKGSRVIEMNVRSAEMTKYASNCFLAVKISFINHLAELAEKAGANVRDIRLGIGTDKRIGMDFLYSGIGYGGSCFPKDVKAFIKISEDLGIDNALLKITHEINGRQKIRFIDKILKYYKNNLKGKTFAVWGLSFKPNTDDMREAPSIAIIEELVKHGACIKAYDPAAMENTRQILGDKITYSPDNYSACENADALLLLTEWMEFRHPDFNKLKELLISPVIFDGRNVYEIEVMHQEGFEYFSMGYNE